MLRIVFICEGNICRSPTAEFVLKNLVSQAGLTDKFDIYSRASIFATKGQPIYRLAKEQMDIHGIPYSDSKVAKPLTKAEYDSADYVIIMENYNKLLLSRLLILKDKSKIHRLLDFTSQPGELSDPYHSRDFAKAYAEIEFGCTALFEKLKSEIGC
ncbi:MAG: low molecular weight phosphotyrosine protein phosphatase [Bacilli bacterium]